MLCLGRIYSNVLIEKHLTWYEVGRNFVCEEIHHQDAAGDEQDAALSVDLIALTALYVAGYGARKVAHSFCF